METATKTWIKWFIKAYFTFLFTFIVLLFGMLCEIILKLSRRFEVGKNLGDNYNV